MRNSNSYKKIALLIVAIFLLYNSFFISMPSGTSYEGELHPLSDIEFIYDLSYEKDGEIIREHRIFESIIDEIEKSKDFIILDMFLFNDDYDRKNEFPDLSRQLTDALIKQKKNYADLKLYFLTDEINNFYGSYESKYLVELNKNNIEIIITDINKMPNSNPIYSGIWRTFIRWLGTSDRGWINNPFSLDSPKVNLRSFLKLMNFKANHRKVLITENTAIISSANPHDASAYHSNIAFKIEGEIINDLIKTEKAVAIFSGSDINTDNIRYEPGKAIVDNVKAMVITEGKIKKHLLGEIKASKEKDRITMGMFYLSDRKIINELIQASNRGVEIKIILDANKDAFGIEKNGIPNRPVAMELIRKSKGNINIKWYKTHGEQYHSKLILIQKNDNSSIIIGGSANFTRRNIGDYNMETNLKIVADRDSQITKELVKYFDRIWDNKDGNYTLDFSAYKEDNFLKNIVYRFQEWSGLSTF